MKHQIKITMEYETEDMDTDGSPLTCGKVWVALDDENIGLIQDLKLHACAGDSIPQLEIVFPDVLDPSIQYKGSFSKSLQETIKKLSIPVLQPNIKIYLRNLGTDKDTLINL